MQSLINHHARTKLTGSDRVELCWVRDGGGAGDSGSEEGCGDSCRGDDGDVTVMVMKVEELNWLC